jgi:hypothetical protein
MTIGLCAGIPLQDPADTWHHGAVFLLRDKPNADAAVTLGGWTTTVAASTRAVVTYGGSPATSFNDTHADALRAANNALDYMCIRGWCDAAIRLDSDDCLVWWSEPAVGTVLRARVILTTRTKINASVSVTDASGNAVPEPPPPTPAQHDAFRFIRMSRTSEYLFDSYRNMFLALERLLSDIRPLMMGPNGRPAESEKAWFTAALQQADALVSAAKLAPAGETAPIDWVYANMYADERSALSHAKPGRYLLPQNDAGRAELRTSLQRLWDYVRELAGAVLGVNYNMSGFYHSGWELLTKPTFDNMTLFVTNKDPSSAQPDDDATEYLIEVPSDPPYTEAPMLTTRSGALDVADLRTSDGIWITGAVAPTPGDALSIVSELPGPIVLGTSLARFEMVVGVRNLNMADVPNFSA